MSFSGPGVADLLAAGSIVAGDAVQGMAGLPHAIRPVTSAFRFCGPAVTVDVDRGDNRACYEALERIRAGDVLVICSGGSEEVAMIGGSLSGHARNCGAAAIVTDGLVRDTAELDRIGLPVWARGITPNAPTKLTVGRVGVNISIGRVRIAPGDILVGDRDGICVVPQPFPPEFAQRFSKNIEREQAQEQSVRDGRHEPVWLSRMRAAERGA